MIGEPIPVTVEADMEHILEWLTNFEQPDAEPDAPMRQPDWTINGKKVFTYVLLSAVWLPSTSRIVIVHGDANDIFDKESYSASKTRTRYFRGRQDQPKQRRADAVRVLPYWPAVARDYRLRRCPPL